MNPHFLWLTETLELLTFFVLGPVLGFVIAVKAWRERQRNPNPKPYGTRCIALGVSGVVLILFAKWVDADVRSALYFLQLGCFLLGLLAFDAAIGYFFPVLLDWWEWHKGTRAN